MKSVYFIVIWLRKVFVIDQVCSDYEKEVKTWCLV